jgi:hypothetical protein
MLAIHLNRRARIVMPLGDLECSSECEMTIRAAQAEIGKSALHREINSVALCQSQEGNQQAEAENEFYECSHDRLTFKPEPLREKLQV